MRKIKGSVKRTAALIMTALMAVSLLPLSAMAAAPANLIQNPGFEQSGIDYGASAGGAVGSPNTLPGATAPATVQPVLFVTMNAGTGEITTSQAGLRTVQSNIISQDYVPDWSTTESDVAAGLDYPAIELWNSGFAPGSPGWVFRSAGASDGTGGGNIGGQWFVEICANFAGSALYQDVSTTSGALYQWSFLHRGRIGTDAAQMLIGDPANAYTGLSGSNPAPDLILSPTEPSHEIELLPPDLYAQLPTASFALINSNGTKEAYADPRGDVGSFTGDLQDTYLVAPNVPATDGPSQYADRNWTEHMGYYTATSDITRYQLYSAHSVPIGGGSVSRNAVGNLVDNASFIMIAAPTTQTIAAGTAAAGAGPLYADLADGFTATPETDISDLAPGTHDVTVDIYDSDGNLVGKVISHVTVTATVKVQYVDSKGKVLKDLGTVLTSSGPTYDVTAKTPAKGTEITVNGVTYVFKGAKAGDPVSGDLTGNKTVQFVFVPKPQTLTVKLVDQNGKVLQKTVISKQSGDPYRVPKPGQKVTINGKTYQFVKVAAGSDPLKGTMTGDKTVIFVLKLVSAPGPGPNPPTGDSNMPPLYLGLMLAGGLTALLTFRRRKTEK